MKIYKKSIATLLAFLLIFNLNTYAFANEGAKSGNESLSNSEQVTSIPLSNADLETYLTTGELPNQAMFVGFLTTVARALAGVVIEAVVSATFDAALDFGRGWLTNQVKPDNAVTKSVKVNYATFDPYSYTTWVCDTCVNSSYYVELLQRSLYSLGFYQGAIDSSFGPQTKAALIAFQKNAGIAQDGSAGPAVWKKMAHK